VPDGSRIHFLSEREDIFNDTQMKLQLRANLILRNNRDFGLIDYLVAISGLIYRPAQKSSAKKNINQPANWTNSGRVSLHVILISLELPPGSIVGVPLFCCSIGFDAICEVGLKPNFIDSNLRDFNLTFEDLKRKKNDLAAG